MDAKANGADIRILYSPLEAVGLAQQNPDKNVVFFAVGFETTAPANAMSVVQAKNLGLKNYSILTSHVLVPPAIEAILNDAESTIHGFLAAGHVCTIMGMSQYGPLVEKYQIPIVVTGFEPVDLLQGIYMTVKQLEAGLHKLENQYTRAKVSIPKKIVEYVTRRKLITKIKFERIYQIIHSPFNFVDYERTSQNKSSNMQTSMTLALIMLYLTSVLHAQSGLNVDHGTSATEDGWLTIGSEDGTHLAIDPEVIQSKFGSNYGNFFINFYGGSVGIGALTGGYIYYNSNLQSTGVGTQLPDARLHVAGTTDASLSSNGLLLIGEDNTANLILDQNELMARDNGSASTLYLNRDGGNVEVFGVGNGSFYVHGLPFGDHGNMQYNSSTGQFYYDNSSRRYKEKITTMKDDWSKILETRPMTYTRPDNPDRWEYGYIAEEIDSIGLTSMVGYDSEGKPEDVRYDKMIIYLVEMLKIQQKQIDSQKGEIESLQKQIKPKRRKHR